MTPLLPWRGVLSTLLGRQPHTQTATIQRGFQSWRIYHQKAGLFSLSPWQQRQQNGSSGGGLMRRYHAMGTKSDNGKVQGSCITAHYSATTRTISCASNNSDNTNLLDKLISRGFVANVAGDADRVRSLFAKGGTGVYCGFDPTAPTLHVGNLVAVMGLVHAHLDGQAAIGLVGGATGRIGDPSGRTSERDTMADARLLANLKGIRQTLERIFENAAAEAAHISGGGGGGGNDGDAVTGETEKANLSKASPSPLTPLLPSKLIPVRVVNNADWYENFNVVDFMATVGRHFRMQAMLHRESVAARLASPQGLSLTEFSYQVFQAYDFYHLHTQHGCRVQLGGSDQWGNITAGTELIRRMSSSSSSSSVNGERGDASDVNVGGGVDQEQHDAATAYGITFPLLTTASGEKFGKSAGNAVWLAGPPPAGTATRADNTCYTTTKTATTTSTTSTSSTTTTTTTSVGTSPYELYQYFLRADDRDLDQLLRLLTLLPLSRIETVLAEHARQPEVRRGQKTLAAAVVRLVHGAEGLAQALSVTEALFGTGEGGGGSGGAGTYTRGDRSVERRDINEAKKADNVTTASSSEASSSHSAGRVCSTTPGESNNNALSQLSAEALESIYRDVPSVILPRSLLISEGSGRGDDSGGGGGVSTAYGNQNVVDIFVAANLVTSRSQAKRTLRAGGLYANNVRLEPDDCLTQKDALHGQLTLLRRGQKNHALVRWQ